MILQADENVSDLRTFHLKSNGKLKMANWAGQRPEYEEDPRS